MKIKNFIKNMKNAGKVLLYATAIGISSLYAKDAKAMNLQVIQEEVWNDYINGANVKLSNSTYGFNAGTIAGINKDYNFDFKMSSSDGNNSAKAAILGKRFGLETYADFNGKKSVSLDAMLGGGVGVSVTEAFNSGKNTTNAAIFGAKVIGSNYLYGRVDGNKEDVNAAILAYTVKPKLGEITAIPLVYAQRSLKTGDSYLLGTLILSKGKNSVWLAVEGSKINELNPFVKLSHSF